MQAHHALLPLLLAIAAPPALATPPQPSVVPDGVPGPGPTLARRVPLSAPLPGARLSLAWTGGRLAVTDGFSGLWLLDPDTGAVSAGALPAAPAPKKKSRKAPPPPPLVPQALAVGGGGAALIAGGEVKVFDPLTGAVRWTQPAAGASRLQWSVDGTGVEGGGNQRHVVWSASSGTPLEAPDTRAPLYAYAALTQRMVVSVGGKLELYDTAGVGRLLEQAEVRAVALSPDTRRVAAGGRGLWLWDADSRGSLVTRDLAVSALAFSPDSRRLAVATEGDEAVLVLDAATGQAVAGARYRGALRALTWTPDGGALLWVGEDALYRADLSEGDLLFSLPGQAPITALTTTGAWVATGDAGGGVAVWGPDGTLRYQAVGPGRVRRLVLDPESRWLAVRQEGDHKHDLQSGNALPCAEADLVCAPLDAPEAVVPVPEVLQPWVDGASLVAPLELSLCEAWGEQLRIWSEDGRLIELRASGHNGSWARWSEGRYTWGAMDPALIRRSGGPDAAVLPPRADALLMVDREAVSLFDGGPPTELAAVVTNTGSGPAYSVRIQAESEGAATLDGAAERARLAPGERLLVPLRAAPVRAGEASAALSVRSLYTAPTLIPISLGVAPFPVVVDKAKASGKRARVRLATSGGPALRGVRVWLAAQGPGGTWTAYTAGETGKMKGYGREDKPTTLLVSDELDLSAPGKVELEYRLTHKIAGRVVLVLQVSGGAPQALPITEPKD